MNDIIHIRETEEQKVYWLSDTHLNHDREFVYGVRGFQNSQDHTDAIINKINELVRRNDILMHAGDFCLNSDEKACRGLMQRINCQNIYMTWGNHNNPLWKIYQREVKAMIGLNCQFGHTIPSRNVEVYPFRFENIVFLGNYAELTVNGNYFVMSHYPIHVWNYMKDGAKMICGHSHYGLPFSQADNLEAKILDVGWDGYSRPLSTKEVLDIMNTKKVFKSGDHHTITETKSVEVTA